MVQASDQALPTDRTTNAQVTITVPRDTTPPRFEQPEYTVEVAEDVNLGSGVIEVKATDESLKVRGMMKTKCNVLFSFESNKMNILVSSV